MIPLTLVVIGKDRAACDAFDASHAACDLRLIANTAGEPSALIANRHLVSSSQPCFGVVHADTIFRAGALEAFADCAISGAVCGIVGRRPTQEYLNRWCFENPGFVATLDCCSVFLRSDLGLRFDAELFDSFHCYVEDLCMQAQERGTPVLVPSADATHASAYPSAEWQKQRAVYRERLERKWAGRKIWTT